MRMGQLSRSCRSGRPRPGNTSTPPAIPQVVLRREVEPDAGLMPLDAQLLAALDPGANYAADPLENLVPAALERGRVEAAEAPLERGL